jgi:DNA repair exonuclease SbcCD nuclease subunit
MKHKGKFFAIPGNHDLLHNNISMLEKTTIGSLALTGALHLEFDKFTIEGVDFQVSQVMKNMEKLPVDDTNSKVLIGHNYMEPVGTEKEWFTKDEIRKLNYKLVFLGHDHQPHEEEYIGNSTLIRMGSLTRIDTQPYNKERGIFYYQLDTSDLSYAQKEVPHEEAQKIFTVEAFQRIGRKKEDITFIQIGNVLSKFKKKDNANNSLHAKLKKIASEKEIEYIKALHELNNVRYF